MPLAFCEWLAVTYGDRGVVALALCLGVHTDMLAGSGGAAPALCDMRRLRDRVT